MDVTGSMSLRQWSTAAATQMAAPLISAGQYYGVFSRESRRLAVHSGATAACRRKADERARRGTGWWEGAGVPYILPCLKIYNVVYSDSLPPVMYCTTLITNYGCILVSTPYSTTSTYYLLRREVCMHGT